MTVTPSKLKKDLDRVLRLQAQIDVVDNELRTVRAAIKETKSSQDTLGILGKMETYQARLKNEVEALYMTLNVPKEYPDLLNADMEYVKVLFLARDLKITIRKRAIGSFFEWDRLDQAAGGKANPLGTLSASRHNDILRFSTGTKLHQQTRNAIARRATALFKAVEKYNEYCQTLESTHPDNCHVPLPRPLPTSLQGLRSEFSGLMDDVLVTPAPNETVHWLGNIKVRKGIQALLKKERCREERHRLANEADNLCRWFGRELMAVELAIRLPSCRL